MKQFATVGLLGLLTTGCVTQAPPQADVVALDQKTVASSSKSALHQRIAHHARVYKVPESLVHRIVRRESNYNPAARNGPYWGLMQIRYDTAQGMGYRGPANRLLDADTNMTYAVAYLANAYRVAGGNENRAVQLYAGGYYYEAKRKGMLSQLIKGATQ